MKSSRLKNELRIADVSLEEFFAAFRRAVENPEDYFLGRGNNLATSSKQPVSVYVVEDDEGHSISVHNLVSNKESKFRVDSAGLRTAVQSYQIAHYREQIASFTDLAGQLLSDASCDELYDLLEHGQRLIRQGIEDQTFYPALHELGASLQERVDLIIERLASQPPYYGRSCTN